MDLLKDQLADAHAPFDAHHEGAEIEDLQLDSRADVARGGSWADAAGQCRSASRGASDRNWNKRDPTKPQSVWWLIGADFVGFRVVRAVEEQAELKDVESKVTRESR